MSALSSQQVSKHILVSMNHHLLNKTYTIVDEVKKDDACDYQTEQPMEWCNPYDDSITPPTDGDYAD